MLDIIIVSSTDVDYSDASAIVLWIGANDLLRTIDAFADEKGIDYERLTASDLTKIKTEFKSGAFRNAMQQAVDGFAANYAEIVQTVAQNSHCPICLLTQFNPYGGVNIVLSSGESLNLGLITEEWIEKLNEVIRGYSDYTIIDTFYPIEEAEEDCVNADINVLTGTYEFDPHLNIAGQTVVYEAMVAALQTDSSLPTKDTESNATLVVVCVVDGVIVLVVLILIVWKRRTLRALFSRRFHRKQR